MGIATTHLAHNDSRCYAKPEDHTQHSIWTRQTQISVVGEHRVYVEALAAQLNLVRSFQVVWTTNNIDDGLRNLLSTEPAVVLLDVQLSPGWILDLAALIRSRSAKVKVVFLFGSISDISIERALRLRAVGFLTKDEPMTAVQKHIELIAAGEVRFSQPIRDRLRYDVQRDCYELQSKTGLRSLSERELTVLRYLACGYAVQPTATELGITTKSVTSHRYRIMKKLGIHDRVELACFAIREGLVQP